MNIFGKSCEVVFIKGERCKPFEYFCQGCRQLRMCFVVTNKCNHCGSLRIIKGKLSELDKEVLKKQYSNSGGL